MSGSGFRVVGDQGDGTVCAESEVDVSDEFLRLVAGLTPPGRGRQYHVSSAVPAHDRLVAWVLAYLADDEGECTVSRAELASYTCLNAAMASAALQRLVGDGVLQLVRSEAPNGPSLHRLLRGVLEARQMDTVIRRAGTVEVLLEYGLSVKVVNSLCRSGIRLMGDLTTRVEAFRGSPSAVELGFDVYLRYEAGVRGVGPKLGVAILKAYDEWRSADVSG
jgi:hypothetical protein